MFKRTLPAHRATRGAGYDRGSASRRCYRSGNGAGRGFLSHAFAAAGALVHGLLRNAYAAFSCTYLCTCICFMRLAGHRCAPQWRATGGAQFGSYRIRRPGPVQAGQALSRSRCHHASRTPLSGCGAQPQGAESSTHSKHIVSESHFSGYTPGCAARRVASARRAHTYEIPGP